MNINLTKSISAVALSGIFAVLSACDSGSTVSSVESSTDSTTMVANDFSFPEIAEANGVTDVSIPDGPAPVFSARRTLSTGSGNTIAFGDPVVLKYTMYSWSTGEIVESTDDFDEPITVRAGVTEGIPEYMSKSLLGRNIGDKLQLVFESGMEDLPEYLDQTDAYVVVVDII